MLARALFCIIANNDENTKNEQKNRQRARDRQKSRKQKRIFNFWSLSNVRFTKIEGIDCEKKIFKFLKFLFFFRHFSAFWSSSVHLVLKSKFPQVVERSWKDPKINEPVFSLLTEKPRSNPNALVNETSCAPSYQRDFVTRVTQKRFVSVRALCKTAAAAAAACNRWPRTRKQQPSTTPSTR